MLRDFGLPEILLILFIVLLLFGVGRISKVAAELGKGIRAFKQGLKGEEPESSESPSSPSKEES